MSRELLLEFAAFLGVPASKVDQFLAKRVEIREGAEEETQRP